MILFWVTFAAFFFGLTYGRLQIVTEQRSWAASSSSASASAPTYCRR